MNPAMVAALVPAVSSAVELFRVQADAASTQRADQLKFLSDREEHAFRMAHLDHQTALEAQQKEVLERVLTIGQHMFDRKMDAIVEIARAVLGLLREHQASLLEEQREVGQVLLKPETTDVVRVTARKRQREIANALNLINEKAVEVEADLVEVISRLHPNFSQAMLRIGSV